MWFAWTFFGLFQMTTNRYLKHHWQTNMWLHRVSGMIVTIVTLLYGIVGIVKLMKVVNDVHAPMGVGVTTLITFLAISGYFAGSSLDSAVVDQNRMLSFKFFHKVSNLQLSSLKLRHFLLICLTYSYSLDICLLDVGHISNYHFLWHLFVYKEPQDWDGAPLYVHQLFHRYCRRARAFPLNLSR